MTKFKIASEILTLMAEYKYDIKIPKERIAILIGKDGETKDHIEKETQTELSIDSKEGDISVLGGDPLKLYHTREIIKAIGRGFNPDLALLLLKSDFLLDVINCMEFAKSKNDLIRLRGRVIGQEGKSRKIIEDLSDCHISVYGKTVSIIGRAEQIAIARKAVDSLLGGSPHSAVYKYLEKQRRDLKIREDDNDFIKDEFKKDLIK